MGDGKAVQVPVLEPHLDDGMGWGGRHDPHTKGLRQAAFANHRLGNGTGGIGLAITGTPGHRFNPLPLHPAPRIAADLTAPTKPARIMQR